jgi:hypothetical protein
MLANGIHVDACAADRFLCVADVVEAKDNSTLKMVDTRLGDAVEERILVAVSMQSLRSGKDWGNKQ